METSALRDAGLTEGEIKVYMALLELGPSTTGPIIDKAGVARSFVPHILEGLIQKGLVAYITKQKTKYYQAATPQKILQYIEERSEQILANKKRVENLLPMLLSLQKDAKTNEVNVYEGFKGITTVIERTYEVLKPGEEYTIFGIAANTPSYQHAFWEKDHHRRVKAKIACRLLFNQDTPRAQLEWRTKFAYCDPRYMHINIKSPAWFMTYKDVAVIGLQENPIAIEIRSADIARSFREYFEEFWKETKPFV